MAIMTHAKFHFNRLMLTLIFGIRAFEPPWPGELLKRPGLKRLMFILLFQKIFQNNLNCTSTSDIREVMEFYNVGNQSFGTDSSACKVILFGRGLGCGGIGDLSLQIHDRHSKSTYFR